MSFSGNINIAPGAQHNGLVEAVDELELTGQDLPEMEPMKAGVREAVRGLLESGALGDNSTGFMVSVSGHVNPGNTPPTGYSNDFVIIEIYRKTPERAAADLAGNPASE